MFMRLLLHEAMYTILYKKYNSVFSIHNYKLIKTISYNSKK